MLSDADKLRKLADWFDIQDEKNGNIGESEVQEDLRRIADQVELWVPTTRNTLGVHTTFTEEQP